MLTISLKGSQMWTQISYPSTGNWWNLAFCPPKQLIYSDGDAWSRKKDLCKCISGKRHWMSCKNSSQCCDKVHWLCHHSIVIKVILYSDALWMVFHGPVQSHTSLFQKLPLLCYYLWKLGFNRRQAYCSHKVSWGRANEEASSIPINWHIRNKAVHTRTPHTHVNSRDKSRWTQRGFIN